MQTNDLPAASLCGHETLHDRFLAKRETQARRHGRALTDINRRAGDVVFNTAEAARSDVRCSEVEGTDPEFGMRVVSLATGTSKSTSAYAYLAAAAETDPAFTAAYIVPTVSLAREAHAELAALTNIPVALWTLEERNVERAELLTHRLVVVCHAHWRGEMERHQRGGARYWHDGTTLRRRSVLIVDELPDLVERASVIPSHVQDFLHAVRSREPEHVWAPVLRQVLDRMNDIVGTQGQRFEAMRDLLSRAQGKLFERPPNLVAFVSDTLIPEERRMAAELFASLCRFLVAASRGACFFSRQDHAFTAYEFLFEPGPGHVLLDATADLAGLTQLRPDIAHIPVPAVSYANLETVLVEIPRDWRRVRDLLTVKDRSEAEAFGAWVYDVLRDNTATGDDILMYAKLALFNQRLLTRADDPSKPHPWEGRTVGTQHYGIGCGSNAWKDKRVVVLVGDHYLRRPVTIADAHAWSNRPLTNRGLKDAVGAQQSVDNYDPVGIYGEVHSGHALRWLKQAALRGHARNFTADGACGPMKLIILTGDKTRVLKNWARLFPGAPLPKGHVATRAAPLRGSAGYAALASMLMTTAADRIDGKQVEARCGVPSRNLPKALSAPTVRPVAALYGWQVVRARDIGERGRSNWLFNPARHAPRSKADPETAVRRSLLPS